MNHHLSTDRATFSHPIALAVLALTFFSIGPAWGQFVAFTGKDSNALDEFAFVALTEIPNGTKIFVTNLDWDNTMGQFSATGEGTLLFTAAENIARGTVVRVNETTDTSDLFAVTPGTAGTAALVGATSWTPTAGDPHYAFTATNDADPINTVTEIYAALLTQTVAPNNLDPSTGTNASVDAIVADFTGGSQPAGIDYSADRSMATPTTLATTSNFTAGAGTITLDLSPFSGPGLPVELVEFSVD